MDEEYRETDDYKRGYEKGDAYSHGNDIALNFLLAIYKFFEHFRAIGDVLGPIHDLFVLTNLEPYLQDHHDLYNADAHFKDSGAQGGHRAEHS